MKNSIRLINPLSTAQGFLDSIISTSLDKTGLLQEGSIAEAIFNNQVKVLNKADAICEKHHINPKKIPLKLVHPILQYSGLEEDENLQDLWANLLSNLVDSEQNIENHVFPYLLSQISHQEFTVLKNTYDAKKIVLEKKISEIQKQSQNPPYAGWDKELLIKWAYSNLQIIPYDWLKEYEIQNLIRLGLAKEQTEYYTEAKKFPVKSAGNWDDEGESEVEVDINIDYNSDIVLTKLGELFIVSVNEKDTI